jgi:hypothetical protein
MTDGLRIPSFALPPGTAGRQEMGAYLLAPIAAGVLPRVKTR